MILKHIAALMKLILTILIISDMTYKPRPPIIEGKRVCAACSICALLNGHCSLVKRRPTPNFGDIIEEDLC
jgi:hypothetical protein